MFGGYWDLDGFFWYQSRSNGPYLRDQYRHFRRDSFHGYKHNRYQDNRHDRDRNNTYPPLFAGGNNDRNSDRDRGGDNRPRGRDDDRGRNNPPVFGGEWTATAARDADAAATTAARSWK